MKRRFILVILIFFIVSYAFMGFLQFHYFEEERLRLIDQQVERAVSLLASPKISKSELLNIEKTNDVIYDALDEQPPNQVILLWNKNKSLIYRNPAAVALDLELPLKTGWSLIDVDGSKLRLLTYKLPERKGYIQVGLVLDQRDLSWENIKGTVLLYSLIVVICFAGISILLTNYLLRPVKELALYFKYHALDSKEGVPVPAIAQDTPEFVQLSEMIETVIGRWRESLSEYSSIMARLIHEIRTPLTVLRNKLDVIKSGRGDIAAAVNVAIGELEHIESLSDDFMTWSKFEYSMPSDPNLFVIDLKDFIKKMDCVKKEADKISFEFDENALTKVFAKPEHLRLILENLIQNARRHGDAARNITIRIATDRIEIRNFGQPVSESVIHKLGQPFNRGNTNALGTGLGLANVFSLCKKYSWRLNYQRINEENVFSILF